MQRMNRNRMGPSFPKAPPARLPMMDFRAKPGFEQKYNILPDISGARKIMDDDDQYYQHDEQFAHSWQSPTYSMGNTMHIGGHMTSMQSNGFETRMPLNRESGHLIDGFYNEPNYFNPGIQRTLTQNHKILPRPCDQFPITKNDAIFNTTPLDRTFISGNVRDMSLYGTKNILPGISKKDKTNIQSNDNRENGSFMKRVQSTHALNVHLSKDKAPLMAIGSKENVETLYDHIRHSEEKQGHINIVPDRFAEILKEEIHNYNDKDNEFVVLRDVQPSDPGFRPAIDGHDSTDCTSFVTDGIACSESKYESIKVDRRERQGIESSDGSNKSFSYEATEKEESSVKEHVDDGYGDTLRRGSHSEIAPVQPDSTINMNHEVEVQFEICDDDKSTSIDYLESIRQDRNGKLGIESSDVSNKSFSYEETENDEDKIKNDDGDLKSGYGRTDSNPEIITVRRDSITCVNHEVEIEYDTSEDEQQENDGNPDDSVKLDRSEKLGIESSDESNKSCSYETTDGDEISGRVMEDNSYNGYNRQMSSPEIITIRRDGMKCVNHEVEIEYEIDDDETESGDIPKSNEAEYADTSVSNTIEKDGESENNHKEHVTLNETKRIINEINEDVFRRGKLKIESKNESNCSLNYELSENEEIVVEEEGRGLSYQNSKPYPEIINVRRDGMMCLNHEVDVEYDQEKEDESCTTASGDMKGDDAIGKHSIHDSQVETLKGTDNMGNSEERFVQNKSMVDLEKTGYLAEEVNGNGAEGNGNEENDNETGSRHSSHFAQEPNRKIESDTKKNLQIDNIGLNGEKRNACIIETKLQRELGYDKVDNDFEISTNIENDFGDSKSNTEIIRDEIVRNSCRNKDDDLYFTLNETSMIKENTTKEIVNTSSEKAPEDIKTSISQRSSGRVIAVEPESVKREHRKRKRERDKIRKSTTRLDVRKNNTNTSSSSTDSKPRALEAKTGQITYETDDDIDNISDKILDENSETYSKGMAETNNGQTLMKSSKKVRFNDELRVYNFQSISSNSTENTNAEDSIGDDTAYDTDEDIDKISNDILDEDDDETQVISKQITVDENMENTVYKQSGDRRIAADQHIIVNKGNNIKTYCELTELPTSQNPKRVPLDRLSKTCEDGRALKVADDMKLTISKGTYEKKRRNSIDMISTDRKSCDLRETDNKAVIEALGNKEYKRNDHGQLKRRDYVNPVSYGYFKGESIIRKNMIGDGDVASTITDSRKRDMNDIGIKLLTISRNDVEIKAEPSLRTKTKISKTNCARLQQNDRFENYASDIQRSELYEKIMSVLETKVGRERAATLMRSKTITEMVENMTTNPEKYGRHFAELIKLREERPYIDLTQYIKDPTKVDENVPWCYFEELKKFALSSDSIRDQELSDSSFSDMLLPINGTQADVNLNADDHNAVKGNNDVKDKNEQSEVRHKRRFSFKAFFRKFICVCKSKVDHDDV